MHNDSLVIVGGVEWNLEMPEVILVDLLSHKASFVQLQVSVLHHLLCVTAYLIYHCNAFLPVTKGTIALLWDNLCSVGWGE